tara:strand:+ start:38 stop:643 length:606 start_codon:yes stop_codon:yes gene_type:complete
MTKSFAQIIAPKINGVATTTKNRQNKVQEIISLTFEHANNCGDYSALSRLVNVLGSHEKRHVIGYVVAHSMNLKYDGKKQQFKKSTKKSTAAFDCEAIAKVTWHEYAKIADKSIPLNADKMYTIAPAKSHDKKVSEAKSFNGNQDAMKGRRSILQNVANTTAIVGEEIMASAIAKLASMTTDELAAFAGIENAKTDLKIAA